MKQITTKDKKCACIFAVSAASNYNPGSCHIMKIGAVSDETGLGIHTIRYYEKQGLIKQPEKDASGHRAYNPRDIEILNWVSCMKNSGMSLNKIKLYTKAFYDNNPERCIAFLEEHLAHLNTKKKQTEHYIAVTKDKIFRFKNA